MLRALPTATIVTAALIAFALPALAAGPKPAPAPGITLSCPLKTGFARNVDLSTGIANWQVSGITFDPATSKAGVVNMASAPPFWAGVAIPGGKWVHPFPSASAAGLNPGQHIFFVNFNVKKSPGEMRILIKGNAVADEAFSVELLEPGPGNASQGGLNASPPAPGMLTPQDMFELDYVVGEASGSKNPRPGRFALRIIVENGPDFGGSMGLLAKIQLTQTCLGRGSREIPKAAH